MRLQLGYPGFIKGIADRNILCNGDFDLLLVATLPFPILAGTILLLVHIFASAFKASTDKQFDGTGNL